MLGMCMRKHIRCPEAALRVPSHRYLQGGIRFTALYEISLKSLEVKSSIKIVLIANTARLRRN